MLQMVSATAISNSSFKKIAHIKEAYSTERSIVNSVPSLSGIVDDLTGASMEQSFGIQQTYPLLTQSFQVTRQNNASMELTSALAEALRKNIDRIAQRASQFEIRTSGAVATCSEYKARSALKPLVVSLIMILTLLLPASASATPLRIGGFVVAPLVTGVPGSPLQGALREYIEQEIAGRSGIELIWTAPTSYPRAMENLKNGQIDILLLSSVSDNEKLDPRLFKWTVLRTHPHLAVLKSSPLQSVQALQQLAGMQIGWLRGSALIDGIEQVDIHWQLLAATDWQRMNLLKLQAGRIQAAFFENEYSPRYLAHQERIEIQLIKLPLPERSFKMAYSLKADPVDIVNFDKAATAAFAHDQFRLFLEKYINR